MGWRPEVAGAAAFLGHCFPVWLGFKGGKGVATFMGTLFALNVTAGIFAGAIWLGVAYLLKFSSLAALIAAAATPFVLFALGKPAFAIAALVMALLIFIRHKANITRLLSGDEPKIGAKKTEAANDRPSVQPSA
jgi:glycerol-3-phosphate acyltransferase PlsY